MKALVGRTFKGIGYLGLLGLIMGVVMMFYTLYQLHGLFWTIAPILFPPATIFIPLYLWLEHGMVEFIFQVYLYPLVAGLLYSLGDNMVNGESKFFTEVLLGIGFAISIGFLIGVLQGG